MTKNRKARWGIFCALSLALAACGGGAPPAAGPVAARPSVRIVASFHPLAVMLKNIAGGVPGVEVACLTGPMTGCLHDYQLTTEAMKTLSGADILVVNGLGMETFLDKVAAQRPDLEVLNVSESLPILAQAPRENGHEHHDADDHHGGHDADDHHGENEHGGDHDHGADPGAPNPHVWVSLTGSIQQVRAMAEGLARLDPVRATSYRANGAAYITKLEALRAEMHAAVDALPGRKIITFHEAFPWFAEEFGLEIVAVVEREPGSEPGAGELAEIVRLVKTHGVRVIFAEPQYAPRAAETIARETGAKVYSLDPCATGPDDPDAYLRAMRGNLETLKEALAAP